MQLMWMEMLRFVQFFRGKSNFVQLFPYPREKHSFPALSRNRRKLTAFLLRRRYNGRDQLI